MNIVSRKYKGRNIRVVYDCPCDPCSNHNHCKTEKMYCSGFTEYVNNGWYEVPGKVGKRLKKL